MVTAIIAFWFSFMFFIIHIILEPNNTIYNESWESDWTQAEIDIYDTWYVLTWVLSIIFIIIAFYSIIHS